MKTNVLVNVLIAVIGMLLILAALQFVGWGRGIKTLEPMAFEEGQLEQLVAAKDDLSPPEIKSDVIDRVIQTPLFREDRQPFVPPVVEEVNSEEVFDVVEVKPLKAQITSIIITNNSRYVMIQDQVSKERLTLKEGMPLDGEQGMWVVDTIDKRKVTFVADGQEPIELELEVFSGALNNAGSNNRAQDRRQQAAAQAVELKQEENLTPEQLRQKKAEEIRQKIAERRAEMRAKAAQGKEQ
ncbi:hypothetical protein [Marinicella gelatinilytica]|uniref:hypothetical protein n=1 Tax=Marinicella gelatinilytica TaxID=2996017 RepID=UPI002260BDF0|nr:hypothetical protein [Marinicella gelatinilytica]MCX7544079.1 hypothetical protein [Marinicella gelatinilytica]